MTESPYPERDARVYFELVRDRLSHQLETIDAIDDKIGMLFSVSTAMLGILGGVLALKAGSIDGAEWAFTAISIVAYVLVASHSRRAYAAREWQLGGDLKVTWRMFSDESDESEQMLEWRVANRLRIAYEDNRAPLNAKLEDLNKVILPSLVTQSASLLVALLLVAA